MSKDTRNTEDMSMPYLETMLRGTARPVFSMSRLPVVL